MNVFKEEKLEIPHDIMFVSVVGLKTLIEICKIDHMNKEHLLKLLFKLTMTSSEKVQLT